MLKYKYSKLYWFFKELSWFKVYFSPFKPIIPRFYLGRTKIGTPYFLPRNWRKFTKEEAHKEALEHFNNPKYVKKTLEEWTKQFTNYQKPIPKKIGFDFVELGWKTKFNSFRHEYNPVWSFVAFGYQVALIFRPEDDIHYWEEFLYYSKDTDKSKSAEKRIEEARKKCPNIWTSHSNGEKVTTDYWTKILKKKYL